MFSLTSLAISAGLAHLFFIQLKSLKPGTQFSMLAVFCQTIIHQAMTSPQNLLAWRGSNTRLVVDGGRKVESMCRLERVFRKSLIPKTSSSA